MCSMKRNRRSLIDNVSRRNWSKVQSMLPTISDFNKLEYSCSNCKAHHNFLHYILQFNPPLSIVKKVVEYLPESVKERNCMNRLPLHNALFFGTSVQVVKFLLRKNKDAIKVIDKSGKALFHLAIDGYELLRLDSFNTSAINENLAEIINILFSQNPSMITKKYEKTNIIDYAIKMDVDTILITYIQSLMDEYKREKNMSKKKLMEKEGNDISSKPRKKIICSIKSITNTLSMISFNKDYDEDNGLHESFTDLSVETLCSIYDN